MSSHLQLFESLCRQAEMGQPCTFCLVVNTHGSTPQTPGACLLLHADGQMEGTLGGGCVEAEAIKHAQALLHTGRGEVLSFNLNNAYGWDDELICGGQMEIAIRSVTTKAELAPFRDAIDKLRIQHAAQIPIHVESEGKPVEYRLNVETTPTLLIAGAGHVGAELARLAIRLDYRVVVIDDRGDLMNPDRLPVPIETRTADIASTLADWPIDDNTYVVIVTRGHRHDEVSLRTVIDSPAKYVGMIGSRRKIKQIFDNLIQQGVSANKLEQVHSPIGIKINAITVPEIAISIAAELIQIRREGASKTTVEGPIPLA